MQIKTKGKCPKCGKMYVATEAGQHLLKCALQSDTPSKLTTEGYLLRISSAEQPGIYWILATIPKNATLALLDTFLRDTWLECCRHTSEFNIRGHRYISGADQSMDHQVGKLLLPDSAFEYVYDIESPTYLKIQVVKEVHACKNNEVSILMQNDAPIFLCESCKKPADIICSQCYDTLCKDCSKHHSCVVCEGNNHMLMTLLNSPRTGVCAYG